MKCERQQALVAELCSIAVQASESGRDLLRSRTGPPFILTKGAPGDVVTEVDREVEYTIREFLSTRRSQDGIIGEELSGSGQATSEIEWYIDPIDGTTNFVNGLDSFCTSVAAFDSHSARWLAGAIHVASTGTTYSAAAAQGAQKTMVDGETVTLKARAPVGSPRLLGVGLSYDPEIRATQLDEIRLRMEKYDGMRSLGSAALALCLVAEGSLDAFIETDLFVYDWAAGALIAEEAGALVQRPHGLQRGAVAAYGVP